MASDSKDNFPEETQAIFGSIVEEYLNRISAMDEDSVDEAIHTTALNRLEELKDIPGTIIDLDTFNELIGDRIPTIDEIVKEFNQSYTQMNDLEIKHTELVLASRTANAETPDEGIYIWMADWFYDIYTVKVDIYTSQQQTAIKQLEISMDVNAPDSSSLPLEKVMIHWSDEISYELVQNPGNPNQFIFQETPTQLRLSHFEHPRISVVLSDDTSITLNRTN